MKLEKIEKLCEEATRGPWKETNNRGIWCVWGPREPDGFPLGIAVGHDEEKTAKFIAASRTLIPKFLAVIKALKTIEIVDGEYEDDEGILAKALEDLEAE